jgi:hypothetical protein
MQADIPGRSLDKSSEEALCDLGLSKSNQPANELLIGPLGSVSVGPLELPLGRDREVAHGTGREVDDALAHGTGREVDDALSRQELIHPVDIARLPPAARLAQDPPAGEWPPRRPNGGRVDPKPPPLRLELLEHNSGRGPEE